MVLVVSNHNTILIIELEEMWSCSDGICPEEPVEVDDKRHSKQPGSGLDMNPIPTIHGVKMLLVDREGNFNV